MQPENLDLEYNKGLQQLNDIANQRLLEWNEIDTSVKTINAKLAALEKCIVEEDNKYNNISNEISSCFSGFFSDKQNELMNLSKESKQRADRLKKCKNILEQKLSTKKIELISVRRRFRTSKKSIEILERNRLKNIVGKASPKQYRSYYKQFPILPK